MTLVAVTGASGGIGRELVTLLARLGHQVLGIGRNEHTLSALTGLCDTYCDPQWFDRPDRLARALAGTEIVIHLADDPDRKSPRSQSAKLALQVAEAAVRAGARRMVFTSSIYARLEADGRPSAYGAGKRQAEKALLAQTGLATLILRLPPVYGESCRGGVDRLARLLAKRAPLPFATARAARDYLWSENLMNLFACVTGLAERPFETLAQTIHEPSDGRPVSTRELIFILGQVLNRKPRLFPVPRIVLVGIAERVGLGDTIAAAFDPLLTAPQDMLRSATGWSPSGDLAGNLAYLARRPI